MEAQLKRRGHMNKEVNVERPIDPEIEGEVAALISDREFLTMFRMSHVAFNSLLDLITPFLHNTN
jgi:hypothetical protein